MEIRDATADDWPAIWPFLRRIVAASDTFSWNPDVSEETARAMWMHQPPGVTVVAVDDDGTVLGTAEIHPNQPAGGPAGHVANAGFMVHPDHAGRGVGRALGEYVIGRARAEGYRAMQFNAVVETNTRAVALWRSLGFEVLATVPEAFHHPDRGYVGLHVMYRKL
ncbi:GNAT family N-acetyltransferase [Allostreptomyces psammosilenae]|uniref:L-amino acid N-acyltransferase YncA n=1 Tax=Allostreptomyces psammosilenae TaxID=1892865 RepID=A0A852ZXQ9_9ACTN|nr:N-acetyltransferase [Allostreptomyces psammosilenae]NYI07173.1 L-amino acid N-acyltransferase YncA [Allostreptomyces psammosilenae]